MSDAARTAHAQLRIPDAPAPLRPGLTYVEVLVSLVILSTATAAGLQALGSYAMGARHWNERATALELAHQLMAEINSLPFADPQGSSGIGLEAGEVAGNRATYNDIDDYHGWDESPLTHRNGVVMSGYGGYRRTVSVVFDSTPGTATGVAFPAGSFKRITVQVFKDDRELTRLVAVRSAYATAG